MEHNELSDELREKLEAVETAEQLTALAKAEGFELSDEVLESIAGGTFVVRKKLERSKDPNCRRLLTVVTRLVRE